MLGLACAREVVINLPCKRAKGRKAGFALIVRLIVGHSGLINLRTENVNVNKHKEFSQPIRLYMYHL